LCCHACCILLRVVVAKSHSPRRINPIQLYFERCVVNFAPHSTRRAEENATIRRQGKLTGVLNLY
jgi:hypothetical protein